MNDYTYAPVEVDFGLDRRVWDKELVLREQRQAEVEDRYRQMTLKLIHRWRQGDFRPHLWRVNGRWVCALGAPLYALHSRQQFYAYRGGWRAHANPSKAYAAFVTAWNR